MSLGSRAVETARRMIEQYGESVTYNAITEGEYDPATASLPTTTQSFTVSAVLASPTRSSLAAGVAQEGDAQVTIAGSALGAVVPSENDTLQFGGATWRIVSIQTTRVQGMVPVYNLIVRKP